MNAEGTSQNAEAPWCLVGNIVQEHRFGEQGEVRVGSKHFGPGTKVYVAPRGWASYVDYSATVIGRPRRTSRFISVTIRSARLIENWRVQRVYNPTVVRLLNEWGAPWSRERAERVAHRMNKYGEKAWGAPYT